MASARFDLFTCSECERMVMRDKAEPATIDGKPCGACYRGNYIPMSVCGGEMRYVGILPVIVPDMPGG